MFTYRKCNKNDVDIWIKLNRLFIEEELQGESGWNNIENSKKEEFEQTFFEALEYSNLISLILFSENNQIVGFANLLHIYSIWSHGKALYLDDLYLIPEIRGKGYGRKAMEIIEEIARNNHCKRLQFLSEIKNQDAMEFYKKLGYRPMDMKFYIKYL